MPDYRLKNQPFDLYFHPRASVVFTGLLTGEIKAYQYDDESGEGKVAWSARPTKRSARSLTMMEDDLWLGGKSGSLFQIDSATGKVKTEREAAHESPINRIASASSSIVTGDDEGVIKFWDTRQPNRTRIYTQHWDYISDFIYFEATHELVATSGDGHISVMDIRSNKTTPLAVSDDQEDELLSIVPIKNDTKCVVGTGLGVLSIWNRKAGWGDSVDRMTGHPASVDAILRISEDVILTGSEDGLVRVIQIQPNKFLGVIASHGDYPIERLRLDRKQKWLGSISHDDCLKLTDVEGALEDSDNEDQSDDAGDEEDSEMPDAEDETTAPRRGPFQRDNFFDDL